MHEHPLAADPQDCTEQSAGLALLYYKSARAATLACFDTWDRVAVFVSTLSASGMHGRAYVASNGGALSYVFSIRTHQRRVERERLLAKRRDPFVGRGQVDRGAGHRAELALVAGFAGAAGGGRATAKGGGTRRRAGR